MNIIRTLCAVAAWVLSMGFGEASADDDIALQAEQDSADVADAPTASRWYARTLGYRIVSSTPETAVLERDGRTLRLITSNAPGALPRFEVDSLKAVLARPDMRVVSGPVVTWNPPQRIASVRATDGSTLELFERLDRWQG
ncbi:MAG: hypothetical protein ABW042_10980 [Phenylobacterium sp.]